MLGTVYYNSLALYTNTLFYEPVKIAILERNLHIFSESIFFVFSLFFLPVLIDPRSTPG
jgi:hypothetical protein